MTLMAPTVTPAAVQRLAQLLADALGRDAQRIVAVDAQHEVHAALEVEAELQLLGHQPRRGRQAEALREHRIDPDGREEHDDADES